MKKYDLREGEKFISDYVEDGVHMTEFKDKDGKTKHGWVLDVDDDTLETLQAAADSMNMSVQDYIDITLERLLVDIIEEDKKTKSHTYEYKRPACAATMAILSRGDASMGYLTEYNLMILLGKRDDDKSSDAYPGCWCLPGGFLDVADERTIDTAQRETLEECSIDIEINRWELFYIDDRPGADPRFDQVINVCYYAFVTNDEYDSVKGADDISEVKWVSVSDALKMKLAFDHNVILRELMKDYRIRLLSNLLR